MSETLDVAKTNLTELAENSYPGRGIVQGLNAAGDLAIQAYWVMGRSENSQNRVLIHEEDTVRTAPFDASKVTDPSLIIYNAMGIVSDNFTCHVVSNGDQTDTIVDGMVNDGKDFSASLKSREFEPDAPNYTPRISGIITPYHPDNPSIGLADTNLSVIRKNPSSDSSIHAVYHSIMTPDDAGLGKCVHTYLGDGSPLPSFDKEPFAVPVGEGIEDTAEMYWDSLDRDNRVALVVKGIHLATNETSYKIINVHDQ